MRSGAPPALAEEIVDLPYLRERVPAAFERAADGIERVAAIVQTMGEQTHPAAHAPADLVATARTALALAGGEADLEPLPPVICDAGAIEQVLVNLLVNAHHATAAGGTVTLRTRVEGDHVRLSVEDTGCGIPPHVAARVFDPFFTTKEVGRGTGQGLAIARRIVVVGHGGTLTFETDPDAEPRSTSGSRPSR